ncbi:hypothetical protein [Nostoc sp. C117]|uniref:hypothetical protein n=1 Tax=Nostoc sp. C117 TaxID=3349875 RepID=UPI00370D69C2
MESQKVESIVIDSQRPQQRQGDECQTLESKPIVIDSQSLKQLQDKIQKEIRELLANSNVSKILNEHGISGQKILKIQCSIDLTQFKGIDTGNGHQAVGFSPEILETRQTTVEFFLGGFCNPCLGPDLQPNPDYPDGCWVD